MIEKSPIVFIVRIRIEVCIRNAPLNDDSSNPQKIQFREELTNLKLNK